MFEKFIKATNEFTQKDKWIPAPYIRKSFNIDSDVSSARLYICTPGFYELFINGNKITKGFLAPYISNPDHLCCYDSYDVARYLKQGENVLGIILGNGFANQITDQWNYSNATFRAPLCVSVNLEVCSRDGVFCIESDESFKTHPSPIIFDMYRYGTHYDARLEVEGWNMPGFDDTNWQYVQFSDAPKGDITECTAHPITVQKEYKPASVCRQKDFCYLKTAFHNGEDIEFTRVDDGYLYDFGISGAGVCKIRIKGERGQKITIRHGERLSPDGKFNINSIYTFKDDYEEYIHLFQTDVYVLRGGEEEIYIPSFTYHGFRYAFVEGINESQATSDLLTFVVFNSDIHQRAGFSCSDETMNKLFDMGINADLSNYHYFPTDCPHREKNGWTGDVSASAEQLMLLFDCSNSFDMWLNSVRKSQHNGEFPGIVPTFDWGYAWGNGPAWDGAAVNVPYYVYKYDGRLDILEENAKSLADYLRYISTRRDEEGLIAVGLGDWCQPGSGNVNISAPLELTDSALVYDMAKKCSFIFDLLGMNLEKAFADKLAEEMYNSVRFSLIDFDTMTAKGACQTSQALLISLGLFTDDEKPKAYERLLDLIAAKGYHVDCGVIGLRHIFEVLTNGGDADLALEMICRTDAPSYGAMIKRGATALCEALEENGVQESENHHFFGDIMRVFICDIAGIKINPDMNNIHNVTISPVFPVRLKYAEAYYDTDMGRIYTAWERSDGNIKIHIEIPDGINAELVTEEYTLKLTSGVSEFTI